MGGLKTRAIVAAGIPVLLVAFFLTAVGIDERLGRAQSRVTPARLAERFHRGDLKTCLRWTSAIDATDTASAAGSMVAAGLDRFIPEALALAWQWTEEAEAGAHPQPRSAEYQSELLEQLSFIDRFWLRAVGRNRMAELVPVEPSPELAEYARRAAERVPAEKQAKLKTIWRAHPAPLAHPADAHLLDALR